MSTSQSTFFCITDPSAKKSRRCFTPQPMDCSGCLSGRVTSICWLEDPFREPRLGILLSCRGPLASTSPQYLPSSGTRQRAGGSRGVLDELDQLSKAPIEFTVTRYFVARRQIFVGSGPVVGICRLPLQLHGLRVNVFQAAARRVQQVLAIVELDEGSPDLPCGG